MTSVWNRIRSALNLGTAESAEKQFLNYAAKPKPEVNVTDLPVFKFINDSLDLAQLTQLRQLQTYREDLQFLGTTNPVLASMTVDEISVAVKIRGYYVNPYEVSIGFRPRNSGDILFNS